MGETAEGRCFTIFFCIYKPGVKIVDFHPAIAGSISASHFAAGPRKLPGPLPDPGRLKPARGVKKCCKTPKTTKHPSPSLPLGLHSTQLPWGSGGLPRLGEYQHWVCHGAGGWADADIHLGDMLGSFRDRFGIILG